jgi:F-box and WD-40 domain protein MET30
MCCFSQLSLLSEQLSHLIRIDPFTVLPREIALRVLSYLDATSLCRAAQVTKRWKNLADDDVLWRGICEQHIGQKCHKCGWGLPVLEKRRTIARTPSYIPVPTPSLSEPHQVTPAKRQREEVDGDIAQAAKRLCSVALEARHTTPSSSSTPTEVTRPTSPCNPLIAPSSPVPAATTVTRPWKDVYCERLTVERNWRRGRCTVRTLTGHTDGVMCLQFSETLSHPSFPVLMTGSYDRTVRVWNMETGQEIRCMRGHSRAVRALQFDDCKLITGSMDHTLRVWDWRTGRCIRTLEGHSEGVVCLNYDADVLASGSVDATIKVWNLHTGERFTLRGHRDWVNSVKLWDNDASSSLHVAGVATPTDMTNSTSKMLFSASDDSTIRLWDLARRACVRQFNGHLSQVQTIKIVPADVVCSPEPSSPTHESPTISGRPDEASASPDQHDDHTSRAITSASRPMLISGSLDNTVKVWDIETGKATDTLFGHLEGVWAVASDSLRLVTGSHDRTIKVRLLFQLSEGIVF